MPNRLEYMELREYPRQGARIEKRDLRIMKMSGRLNAQNRKALREALEGGAGRPEAPRGGRLRDEKKPRRRLSPPARLNPQFSQPKVRRNTAQKCSLSIPAL